MEALPSYEAINGAITENDADPTTPAPSTPAVPLGGPTILPASPLIGGSGVRIPLSHEARTHYDDQVIRQLRSYGPLTRINNSYPANSPLRTQAFHPDQFYQSAISQLDRLLEVLPSNALPAATTLRTITLRVRLPAPDADYVQEARQNGLVQGRGVINRAFRLWFQRVASDKGAEALFEVVDSLAGRITIEGFVILEEWWDLRRGVCMYTVRC